MGTRQLYSRYLESKVSITSRTITGTTFCFPSDPTGVSCSTLPPSQTPWHQRYTLAPANSSGPMLESRHGATSTTSASIGKTAEVAETRVEALPSGTMAGELWVVGTSSHTITAQPRPDIRTCVRSTSLILSP